MAGFKGFPGNIFDWSKYTGKSLKELGEAGGKTTAANKQTERVMKQITKHKDETFDEFRRRTAGHDEDMFGKTSAYEEGYMDTLEKYGLAVGRLAGLSKTLALAGVKDIPNPAKLMKMQKNRLLWRKVESAARKSGLKVDDVAAGLKNNPGAMSDYRQGASNLAERMSGV